MDSYVEETERPWKIPIPDTIEILFESQLAVYEDPKLTAIAIELILSILDWDYHVGFEH